MYIYDNVVILSSMWYVLRFEHAHGLKRYNDRRMTRRRTSKDLAPVVQRADNFIHWIGRYPAEEMCARVSR